jgi:hypothetical protein
VNDVLVVPLQKTPSRGGTRVHPVDVRVGSRTNARGEFRLQALEGGSYYLVALPRNVPRDKRLPTEPDAYLFGHAITYFPAAERMSEAKAIALPQNGSARADITLAPAHLARISGIAFGSNGRPVQGGMLGVAHGDNLFGVDSTAVPIGHDGSFAVLGLPPGTYFLQFREGRWPPPRDIIPRVSGAKVNISDADVTHVRVAPIEMVTVTGRLVLDAGQRALQSSEIRVSGAPLDSNGNPGPQRPGVVRPDLTFEFRTWPGQGYIRVSVGSQEWATRRIRVNGVDIRQGVMTFEAGRDINGVEVELDKPLTRKRP